MVKPSPVSMSKEDEVAGYETFVRPGAGEAPVKERPQSASAAARARRNASKSGSARGRPDLGPARTRAGDAVLAWVEIPEEAPVAM